MNGHTEYYEDGIIQTGILASSGRLSALSLFDYLHNEMSKYDFDNTQIQFKFSSIFCPYSALGLFSF